MAQRANILDGLAWASLTEQARVARVSAQLVRECGQYNRDHTKTRVKDAVRNTSPPYGRAKFIVEAVEAEYRRQLPIYQERQERHNAWRQYQEDTAKRATRLNNAYAAAFGRPRYFPRQQYVSPWSQKIYSESYYEAQEAFAKSEQARDVGDECIAITHQNGYVVALVESENGTTRFHIATRLKHGPIVRTYLRTGAYNNQAQNLVAAAVSLGGTKAKAAFAKGKQVDTDWVGRRTFIHHDGRDHVYAHVEEIPWRVVVYEVTLTGNIPGDTWPRPGPYIVLGDDIVKDVEAADKDHDLWNDID